MSVVPSQILYLEHSTSRLYAEAIQVVENRRLCWARPTLLICGLPESRSPYLGSSSSLGSSLGQQARQAAIATAAANPAHSSLSLYDLKDCPDLPWPLSLFEIACDVDFFALLVQLKMNPDEISLRNGSSQLNTFIHSFWHTHADVFKPATREPLPSAGT